MLGANDGIVSTASLIIGVAAADATQGAVLVAGVAGLVAGAMSMAAGEYVSVSSQADTEQADIARERARTGRRPDARRSRAGRHLRGSAGWMPNWRGRWPCN
ncbi:MAG: VIT1/CCC1 transporter family protein [Desulfosudis oleivorans]|nr:VIT1/CCC1 transporter family protein [Desulfosudis oleivorans]